MKVIYRYDEPLSDFVPIVMPQGAKLLHVAPSDRIPTGLAVWALVDPKAPTVGRVLFVVGTGNPLSPEAEQGIHLGSFQDGPFVWHVFDLGVVRLADEAS
jgi:hypothetical protein